MAYEKNEDGTYVDLEYTHFPAEVDSWENSQDITKDMLSAANSYRSAMLANEMESAKDVLTQYPKLKTMMINADLMNKIKHAVMALERMFTEDIQDYIKGFMESAKTYAANALESQNAAKDSETNAKSSETAAASSEVNAKSSETNAKESETSAAASADAAAKDLVSISDAEETCTASAKAAAESAAQAEQYKNAAKAIISTDETLTVSGAAADAAATGIAIESVRTQSYTIVVPASGWIESNGFYTNTVDVAGVTKNTLLSDIYLENSYVGNDMAMAAVQSWSYLDTGDGTVTFYSDKKISADFAIMGKDVK